MGNIVINTIEKAGKSNADGKSRVLTYFQVVNFLDASTGEDYLISPKAVSDIATKVETALSVLDSVDVNDIPARTMNKILGDSIPGIGAFLTKENSTAHEFSAVLQAAYEEFDSSAATSDPKTSLANFMNMKFSWEALQAGVQIDDFMEAVKAHWTDALSLLKERATKNGLQGDKVRMKAPKTKKAAATPAAAE